MTGPRASTSGDPSQVTTRAEFGQALTQLRVAAGLTVRELAERCDIPLSTLGGYLSGTHLPTLKLFGHVDRVLDACGVTDPRAHARWRETCERLWATTGRRTATPASGPPFMGLRSYQPADAAVFFGREALTDRLEALVGAEPGPGNWVCVVGPSGSGKSSLVRAGLVPRLTASRGWRHALMTPGPDPLAELARCLRAWDADPATGGPDQDPDQRPDQDPHQDPDQRPHQDPDQGPDPVDRVLVVDQLEEVFAEDLPDSVRQEFLARLHTLPASAVVLVLRADFYGDALAVAPLRDALARRQLVVGPMSQAELRSAITGPVVAVGGHCPEALVTLVLEDLTPRAPWRLGDATAGPTGPAAHEAGALPLLSHALLETWGRARRGSLRVEDYQAAGGLRAAVASTAEGVYSGLSPAEQAAARRVLQRLVAVTDGAAVTRRRARLSEVEGSDEATASAVRAFVSARLLTVGDGTVEIAHEALITAWPRLKGWLDDDRAGLALHRRLTEAARNWEDAGRDGALLLRGGRLQSARDWLDEPGHAETADALEREFLAGSIEAEQSEQSAQRRRARRLQSLVAALVVVSVAATVLAVYSVRLRSGAALDRDLALSRQLAETAARIRRVDPSAAADVAVLARRTATTTEARAAVIDSSARPFAARLPGPGGPAAVTTSQDGTVIAAVGDRGGLRVWSAAAGPAQDATFATTTTLDAADPRPLYAVVLSPDGRLLAAGGASGTVRVYAVDAGVARPTQQLSGSDGTVLALALSPDATTLAAASADGHVYLWRRAAAGFTTAPVALDARTGTEPRSLQAVAFNPAGTALAAGGQGGFVRAWRFAADAGAEPTPWKADFTGPTKTVTSLAFSPDGTQLLAGAKDQNAYLWTLGDQAATGPAPGEPAVLAGAHSWVNCVTFSPDGQWIVAGSSDHHLRIYEAGSRELISDVPHPGPVTAALPWRGGGLLTGAADGIVRAWATPVRGAPVPGGRVFAVAYGPDGHLYAAGSGNALRAFTVSDDGVPAPRGAALTRPAGTGGFDGTAAVSASGRLLITGTDDGTVHTWDTTTTPLRLVDSQRTQQAIIENVQFSPDGELAVSTSDDTTFQLWRVSPGGTLTAAGEPVRVNGGQAFFATFSPDGRRLAVGTGTPNEVSLWDVRDPGHPARLGAPLTGLGLQVYAVAFSPNGSTLAVGSADRTVRLADVTNPGHARWLGEPLLGAGDYVFSVAFSPDGRTLAAGSGDGVVRLWDVGDRAHPAVRAALTVPDDQAAYMVAFSPDGRLLAAGGAANTVTLWRLDDGALAQVLCRAQGMRLSPSEQQQYLPSVPYTSPCP